MAKPKHRSWEEGELGSTANLPALDWMDVGSAFPLSGWCSGEGAGAPRAYWLFDGFRRVRGAGTMVICLPDDGLSTSRSPTVMAAGRR